MLTDTGPILAILDRGDSRHAECLALAHSFKRGPFLTTWACFTEMMYLLGRRGGYPLQKTLWKLWQGGRLRILEMTEAEIGRAAALMEKYNDTPMDLGDASLVAVAESRSLRQVFTLDRHFWGYRLADGSTLEPVPSR